MARNDKQVSWTKEMIIKLGELAKHRLSASRIAQEINLLFGTKFTKNSIIGKAYRMRIPLSAKAPPRGGYKISATKKVAAPKIPAGKPTPRPQRIMTMPEAKMTVPTQVEESRVAIPHVTSRRISIMELRKGTCRWPLGDPLKPDFVFCGADCAIGRPYCTAHAQTAYIPSTRKTAGSRAA
jgi:GcrA cell cycle regulator